MGYSECINKKSGTIRYQCRTVNVFKTYCYSNSVGLLNLSAFTLH